MYRLVESTSINADNDPGVWEEVVGPLESFDIFISCKLLATAPAEQIHSLRSLLGVRHWCWECRMILVLRLYTYGRFDVR